MNDQTVAEDKRKHLEFIQGVINRLSSNSFLFKGWSITMIGGIFTLFITRRIYNLLWLILGAIILFWFIDAYYLALERCYRDLYTKVCQISPNEIDYDMKISDSILSVWFSTITRPVLLGFYGILLITTLALIYFLK